MDTDESILLGRWLADRDADAFVQLAMRHAKMVYRVALRILGNPHDAEEIAQDCFEALASTNKPPRKNLSGWLYQVAINQAKNRARSERRRQDREERYLATISADPSSESDVSWDDVHRYVDETILTLPEIYREPLIAHFFEQQTHETIAQRLGLARSSVSHRIQQGIEAVRQELKKRGIPVSVAVIGTWFEAQATEMAVPSARLTDAIARIGMAGIGGTAMTSGSMTLLGKVGVMVSAKWVVGGIAAVLVVGSALFLGSRLSQVPVSSPVPSAPMVTPEKETASTVPPTVEPPSIPETTSTQVATSAASLPTALAVDEPLASLCGFWLVTVKSSDFPDYLVEEKMEIRKEESGIVMLPLASDSKQKMVRPIRVLQLTKTLEVIRIDGTLFSGTYMPNSNSFTLSGSREYDDPPVVTTLVFTRIKEDSQAADQLKKKMQRKEEVQAIYSALDEYKKNSGDKYPERLEDIARFFKGNTALLTSSLGREITYHPQVTEKPKALFSNEMLQWDSQVQYADQIVGAEAQLHKNGVYAFLLQPALVSIKYSNPQQRVSATCSGSIIEEGYDVPLSEEDATKSCEACQKNLKQLGLIEKMFATEHHGYISGGWAMVYPEHMSDPAILSCPCRPLGDDSYELLFPGVSEESFCQELYATIIGESADQPPAHVAVPMIVERSTHTVNGKQGRNVLFFDGHAEFITMNDLPQKVERFIKANK